MVSVPYTFVNGTIIDAGQVNANFAALTGALPVPLTVPLGGTGATNLPVTTTFNLTGTFLLGQGTSPVVPASDAIGTVGKVAGGNVVCVAVGQSGFINLVRVNGTLAAPTAVLSGQSLGAFFLDGYGATGFSSTSRVQLHFNAAENWTDAAQGTNVDFLTTAPGTTITANRMRIGQGVTLGAITTDQGAGTLNATGVYANSVLLTSDARQKRDIAELPDDCLALVTAITPKTFKHQPLPRAALMRSDPKGGSPLGPVETGPPGFFDRTNWGFIAQEVEAAMSSAGHDFGGHVIDGDGNQNLSPSDLVAVLWKAVQELSAQVAQLKAP